MAFTKKEWNLILQIFCSGALLSKWKFGYQNIVGPFQFLAHGGIRLDLPGNSVAGYRFYHVSDATMYGCDWDVDLHTLELSYSFE